MAPINTVELEWAHSMNESEPSNSLGRLNFELLSFFSHSLLNFIGGENCNFTGPECVRFFGWKKMVEMSLDCSGSHFRFLALERIGLRWAINGFPWLTASNYLMGWA
ncbi:hypothetical protein ACLOJK_022204 [Asimina triloba]